MPDEDDFWTRDSARRDSRRGLLWILLLTVFAILMGLVRPST